MGFFNKAMAMLGIAASMQANNDGLENKSFDRAGIPDGRKKPELKHKVNLKEYRKERKAKRRIANKSKTANRR